MSGKKAHDEEPKQEMVTPCLISGKKRVVSFASDNQAILRRVSIPL